MKIFFYKLLWPITVLFFLCFSKVVLANGLTTKSMMVSLALPAIAGTYSLTSGDYEGVKEWGLSCLITLQVTTLLKNSVHRMRPNGGDDLSFPSGHAASAFVGASYLHHRYGWNWGIPMYAIAVAVSVERVNVHDHYWTDVIAGAALGYFTAAYFTVPCPNVWLEPMVDPRNKAYGIQMRAKF